MTYRRFFQFLIFLNTFTAEAIFRQRAMADKSIDAQIIIKLAVWSLTFGVCVFFYKLWAKYTLRLDRFLEALLLFVILISCLYAPSPLYSFASAFSLVAVFLLMYLSSATLSNEDILWPFILGSSLVSLISIIVYFVSPDFGRMKEWIGGVHVAGPRLTGITGTANAIGYIAALSCLAIYCYRKINTSVSAYILMALAALNFSALLMSNSRTSLAGLMLAILIGGLIKFNYMRIAAFCFAIGLLAVLVVTVDHDAVFSMISRSGDAAEIATGTGRTLIWKETLELVSQKPFLGWGYASSVQVFPQYISIDTYTPPHSHNAFLQVLFCCGIVGLLLFIAVFLVKLGAALWYRDEANLAFIIFLLIDGMAEPIAFSSPVTTTALAFALVLSLKITPYHERRLSNPPPI